MPVIIFLLFVIFILAFFIYFSALNQQDVTIFYYAGKSFTLELPYVVVGAVAAGLLVGLLLYLFGSASHRLQDWRKERKQKKTREAFSIYREGVGRLLSGDLKKARILLKKALDKEPKRVETLIALASVCQQEGNHQEAVSHLLRARQLEPKSLEVHFKLAALYEEMEMEDEAHKIYEEILEIDKENRKALRGRRDLFMHSGKWKSALELQKRIIKVSQGTARHEDEKNKLLQIKYEVATLDLEQANYEPAKVEFTEIITQAPEFVPARVSLGDANRQQGRTEDAARLWQEGYKKLKKGIFLARLEDLYMEAEDPSTLLTFYRQSLAENNEDALLRLYYAKLCLRLEMVDEAGEQVFAMENAGVDHPVLHLLAAEVHRRRHRADEALNEYRLAIGVDRRLRFDFQCEQCGHTQEDWSSRCRQCGAWGALTVSGRQGLDQIQPIELRAIHHGERA